MRSLFRRKRDDSDDNEDKERSFPGLGVFSPLSKQKSPQPSPKHELKRLSELEEIFLRSKKVHSLSDVPGIIDEVRKGNIVLLDISRLNDGKDHSHLELRRIIERIRGETRGYRAEIALVNDDCMIVTPHFVRL
ncbi:cell division protein SepF [Candidatus Thorarchaeota archaeon]|nr:MAG: cell division protein SepF [Candidatus Thorarchaeota archaeon]